MATALRLEHPGAVWHVTSRSNNRGDIYLGDEDHLMFLGIFVEAVRRAALRVIGDQCFRQGLGAPELTLPHDMKVLTSAFAAQYGEM